jgi:hypothetical protein
VNNAALIDRYCEVWSEHNESRRAELLVSVWASGATYTDPTVHMVGAEALLAHIAKVQARRPDSRIVRTSEVDEHHRVARFAWCAIGANGKTLIEGLDVALFSDDGSRIERREALQETTCDYLYWEASRGRCSFPRLSSSVRRLEWTTAMSQTSSVNSAPLAHPTRVL